MLVLQFLVLMHLALMYLPKQWILQTQVRHTGLNNEIKKWPKQFVTRISLRF